MCTNRYNSHGIRIAGNCKINEMLKGKGNPLPAGVSGDCLKGAPAKGLRGMYNNLSGEAQLYVLFHN